MDIKKILTQRAEEQFNEFAQNLHLEVDTRDLAEQYIRESYIIEQAEDHLLAVEFTDNKPGRLIKFNLIAAASFIVGLIGGIAGANNPVVLGSVIVNSVISLNSLIEKTTKAEGALFWVIYEMDGHEGKRNNVQTMFNNYCIQIEEINSTDFHTALHELIDIGIVEQHGELLKVTDKIVFLWFRES